MKNQPRSIFPQIQSDSSPRKNTKPYASYRIQAYLSAACHGTATPEDAASIICRACRSLRLDTHTHIYIYAHIHTYVYPRVARGGLRARAHIICRKSGNLPGRRQLSTRPRRPRGILVVRVVNEFAGTWHRERRPPSASVILFRHRRDTAAAAAEGQKGSTEAEEVESRLRTTEWNVRWGPRRRTPTMQRRRRRPWRRREEERDRTAGKGRDERARGEGRRPKGKGNAGGWGAGTCFRSHVPLFYLLNRLALQRRRDHARREFLNQKSRYFLNLKYIYSSKTKYAEQVIKYIVTSQ